MSFSHTCSHAQICFVIDCDKNFSLVMNYQIQPYMAHGKTESVDEACKNKEVSWVAKFNFQIRSLLATNGDGIQDPAGIQSLVHDCEVAFELDSNPINTHQSQQ